MNRAAAARRNGALSNGPVTDAGKAISSRNATRYGLTAAQIVIPGENPAEYEALAQAFADDYQPATIRENDLLSEMAAARWRLRRLPMMEQATFSFEFARIREQAAAEHLTPEQEHARAWNAVTLSPAMKQIHRHETRLRRAYEKARVELETLIQQRTASQFEPELPAQSAESQAGPFLDNNQVHNHAMANFTAQRQNLQNEPAAVAPPTGLPQKIAA